MAVGVAREVIFWLATSTAAVGAAIWSRRLVRTAVLKSEIVDAACVPVWLARAYGSETILAAVIVPSAISAATIVPSTRSAEVIVPPRSNLVLAIAALVLMSALTIVSLAIIVLVTVPVSA